MSAKEPDSCMRIYVWRHNRKFHSHSMIDEPCVNHDFYTDALAIVAARSLEEAAAQLAAKGEGWCPADLMALTPKVYSLDDPQVIYTELRGS